MKQIRNGCSTKKLKRHALFQERATVPFKKVVLAGKSMKQSKHNLKLPVAFRERFAPPYENFLMQLLEQTKGYDVKRILGSQNIIYLEKQAPRGTGWTVWVSPELREEFMQRKQEIGPITHGVFIEILMAVRDQIHSQESYIPITPTCSTPNTPPACDKKSLPAWLAFIVNEVDV